jgi:hypothetical protein
LLTTTFESDSYFADIYYMNKETSEIVSTIETFLKEVSEKEYSPEDIGIHIADLLIKHNLVNELFLIEVVPLKDCYVLRSRNLYTTNVVGSMPGFCKICGKLLGKNPCTHNIE